MATRPWRLIARELCKETDPVKVLKLSLELNQALEEDDGQEARVLPHDNAEESAKPIP
jgi:hypothetical protein